MGPSLRLQSSMHGESKDRPSCSPICKVFTFFQHLQNTLKANGLQGVFI